MSDIYAQIDEDSARNECLHENGQGSKYEENERNLRRTTHEARPGNSEKLEFRAKCISQRFTFVQYYLCFVKYMLQKKRQMNSLSNIQYICTSQDCIILLHLL